MFLIFWEAWVILWIGPSEFVWSEREREELNLERFSSFGCNQFQKREIVDFFYFYDFEWKKIFENVFFCKILSMRLFRISCLNWLLRAFCENFLPTWNWLIFSHWLIFPTIGSNSFFYSRDLGRKNPLFKKSSHFIHSG